MIEVVTSKNGLNINKINGFLTHSLYDPIKEAKKFVQKHVEDVQIHILYGYGSGYIVNEFKNNNPFNTMYVVIDPFVTLEKINDTDFVKYCNFKEVEQCINFLKPFVLKLENNIKFTCSLNYDKIDEVLYKEILVELKELISVNKVLENTVLKFSHLWLQNYLQNIHYPDSSVVKLSNSTNKPVIVASGGPSLSKQLYLLKKHRENFIVISAGSTTNSLVKADIMPDFVVSVDGHELNYKHFEHLHFNEDITYVYSMYSYPKIRNHFQKGFYFLDGSGEVVSESLKEFKKEDPILFFGGGSVAHYALILANYISSGPIAMIGQDLSYVNGYTHAKNNILGKKITSEEQRNAIPIEGYYGGTVYTNNMFLSMKKAFENISEHLGKGKAFNCTEGGALIKGLPNKSFKSFCEENYSSANIDNPSFKAINFVNEFQNNPLDSINKISKKYVEIKSAIDENIALTKLAKKKRFFSKEVLTKMIINDDVIKDLSHKDIISIGLQSISIKVQKGFKKSIHAQETEKFQKSIEENEFLYAEMKKLVNLALKILEETKESLEV